MNDTMIVAVYVVLDDVLRLLGHRTHALASVSDAEVLTVAVVAAGQFQNHHERALCMLQGMGYLSGRLSVSRFNRWAHALMAHLGIALDLLVAVFAVGEAFVIDSMPVPVCARVRAGRCRKVQGRRYCGYCAAKEEKFFGWRLHLICTPRGIPVAFALLPAAFHDLTPIYALTAPLPGGAWVYADKGYHSANDEAWLAGEWGIRLVPRRRDNMTPNSEGEREGLRRYRHRVETVNSQLAAMGVQHLHARTNAGVALKMLAALFALTILSAL